MKSAECKPNCQPVTLSFTVKLPYGQLVAQWKGLRQRYLRWDNLEPFSRPRVRAELKRLNPREDDGDEEKARVPSGLSCTSPRKRPCPGSTQSTCGGADARKLTALWDYSYSFYYSHYVSLHICMKVAWVSTRNCRVPIMQFQHIINTWPLLLHLYPSFYSLLPS